MTVDELATKITWMGHDTFRIEASKVIYFDPFQISGGPWADVIFLSHEHYDHCVPEAVEAIAGPDTVIVTEKDCAAKLSGLKVEVMTPGDKKNIAGLQVEAVPAYNIDPDRKGFHPLQNAWLGFIVDIDGVRVYHAGDTDHIPEMKLLENIGIALLPVSGTYVMTADEAVAAAKNIKPQLAIPMHYDAIVGTDADAARFKAELEGFVPVTILAKGQ
jgi:L-ascorbate metabolism protein UlaG (beta-lactamase superfamily)